MTPTSAPPRLGLAPLRLTRLARCSFSRSDAGPVSLRDPGEVRYYTDMADRYGLVARPEVLADEGLVCYSEMADALLAMLSAHFPLEPLDVIVVGHTVPDLDIGRFVGCTLAESAPGDALPFAITDQGNATAFTALRLAGEYARGEDVHSVLVVLLDQTALPYDSGLAAGAAPLHDTGIGLLFSAADTDVGLDVRQFSGVAEHEVAELLAATVAELSAGRDTRLVLGPGLPHPAGQHPVVAAPGRPASGLWFAFDESAESRTGNGSRVILADYDPTLRYLCIAAVEDDRP